MLQNPLLERAPPPWKTCEAILSQAFHLIGIRGGRSLAELLRRRAVVSAFHLDADADEILRLMEKYAHVPMSLADACLVRMTEVFTGPVFSSSRTRPPASGATAGKPFPAPPRLTHVPWHGFGCGSAAT